MMTSSSRGNLYPFAYCQTYISICLHYFSPEEVVDDVMMMVEPTRTWYNHTPTMYNARAGFLLRTQTGVQCG